MTKTELRTAVDARLSEMDSALSALPDENAVDALVLFPKWEPDHDYVADYRLRHMDKLYRVVQAHKSQEGWEPDKTPALFTEVAKPGEIPVWKQPTGAQDAYMTGDKVHYPAENDPVYICTVDYNVYAPGVYGWDLVS